ncbi:hypothetical protein [Nocardia farcinica]|uniref:hypothetical protein n=1 Tax=Nocardia farcinica TaxID=37329 RepID=UPI0024569CFB|nr:hypothetical protein [Nocardia farcinica]
MSTAVETTMPAQADPDAATAPVRPAAAPRSQAVRPICTAPATKPAPSPARPAVEILHADDLEARLIAAQHRAAELEAQLAAVTAALEAAEHQAAQLEDRNRELASDLDDALDQLAGHALHAEQERLIRTPAWSPWPTSTHREGVER